VLFASLLILASECRAAQTTDLVRIRSVAQSELNCGRLYLAITGVPGTSFVIEVSTDLKVWEPMREAALVDWCLFSLGGVGNVHTIPEQGQGDEIVWDGYADTEWPPAGQRFFRLKLQQNGTESSDPPRPASS
jgi:hypothetical protein